MRYPDQLQRTLDTLPLLVPRGVSLDTEVPISRQLSYENRVMCAPIRFADSQSMRTLIMVTARVG